MIRRPLEFHRPRDIDEATALLSRLGTDAAVLGGGTMLVPAMTLDQTRVQAVVALTALQLDAVSIDEGHVVIGAMTSYATLLGSSLITDHVPLLRCMASQVTGGPSIWNQGTIGGSAAYANPASDVPSCLAALEARFELVSTAGSRQVDAVDFFIDAFRTARRPDELLARIIVPIARARRVVRYDKHKFCASSWPIVTVACLLEHGLETTVTLSVGGASTKPTFQRLMLNADEMRSPTGWIDRAAHEATAAVGDGWSDGLATAAYRRAIVPAVVRRSLQATLKEATS